MILSVTLEDIAVQVGVSRATVSRALNNSSLVNERTKEQVLEAARRMRYRPNTLAKGLVKKQSCLVGVISSSLSNSFYTAIIHGIEAALSSTEFIPIFFDSCSNPDKEKEHLDTVLRLQVDGIILSTTWPSTTIFSDVIAAKVPLVFVDNIMQNIPAHSVTIDNYYGTRTVVEYLIANNHKNIYYLSGCDYIYVNRRRLEGYCDAMRDAGLAEHVYESGVTLNDGYVTMKALLESGEMRFPASVCCLCDETAIGAIKAIKEYGLSVPDDMSVVGFDNLEIAEFIHPSLTTIAQPRFEMGKTAAEILLSCITNREDMDRLQNVVYTPKLIIRESVAEVV